MEFETMKTLKHKNIFFVITDKNFFLFPESENNQIQKPRKRTVCLKNKHIPAVTVCAAGRIVCTICHKAAAPEDFISPMYRQIRLVLCRACMENLKKRAERREAVYPHCKDKKSDKTYQKEILGFLFSLVSRQTFLYFDMKPDMEVETVTRFTRQTKVVLSNIAITDVLFLGLMSNTAVEIRNRISLVGHDESLNCCLEELDTRTREPDRICFDEYTRQEMKQTCENIATIPKNSIQARAEEIHAVQNGICVLLKLFECVDGCIQCLSLKASRKKYMEEMFQTEMHLGWIGRVKRLCLVEYAMEILLKLKLHQENEMEELGLKANRFENITEILKEENNSIWVGKVKRLILKKHAIQILSKLRIHDENEMEELVSDGYTSGYVTEIPKTENSSIWVGRVKRLKLEHHAVEILPKLRIHRENVMEELVLDAYNPQHIAEVLKAENSSIWVGRVKRLKIEHYAVGILAKLRFHEENVIEELGLDAETKHLTEILKAETSRIWVGKVKRLVLDGYAVGILPRLSFHKENEMKELGLWIRYPEHITEILKAENNSIWVGKIKNLSLRHHAVEILSKLRIHRENEMEVLSLWTRYPEHITEIIKTENNSIWVGKVKVLRLEKHAIQVLPKLRIHEENVMGELRLNTDCLEHITEILKTENSSIWMGKVKVLCLRHHAVEILPKLRIHGENVMEELSLSPDKNDHLTEILKEENKSIWIGKVKRLVLERDAVEILSKLGFHEENEIEELNMKTYACEKTPETLKTENNTIWVGKVKRLVLDGYAVDILPRLRFHKENQIEELSLCVSFLVKLNRILKNNSIWVGKVKRLELTKHAVKILPRLRLHRENEMEELVLNTKKAKHIVGILREKNKSIWIGKVRKIDLRGYAKDIENKLDFTMMEPDTREENGSA
ncbi:MAG: uncharacterized protein A8A55_0279 [Amphiamblys sp. WSBS2006]|nr:MAG: uncharacterized protein A8A55_0279 [Amphiamblys sp. WSBS2006]